MAKYEVTRSCGHTETIVLFGKLKNREWRLEKVEPSKLCTECYQAELARLREEENREAAEVAKEMNLPQLTGSEKQIAWAETIRQKMMADIDEFIYKSVKSEMRNDPKLLEAVEYIKGKTQARWWIDHRGMNMSYELRHLLEEAAKEVKEKKLQPPPEVVAEARAEATVRPENPKTETVAEIRALENSVEIQFPEKREDFREVVKKQLKMEWDGKWVRKLSGTNGTPQDRAVEAGHRLLAAGFPIRIYDEELRTRAVAGDYKPECTNWVMARMKGEYEGWFAINWDRKDDYYNAARRLPGARWSSPSMVIPSENFADVLDFAERYGFKFTKEARVVVETARIAKENALVAKVELPKGHGKVVADGKPPVLDVPKEVEIDESLLDRD